MVIRLPCHADMDFVCSNRGERVFRIDGLNLVEETGVLEEINENRDSGRNV